MRKTELIQIDTGYACAAVVVDKRGTVVETAPIFSWMKGKSIREIREWKRIKRITFEPFQEGGEENGTKDL